MKIYIASSWKNRHGVEMLTYLLRERKHEVISWIENCDLEGAPGVDFEKWVETERAEQCFLFDTDGATKSDLFIYYGPAGKDACAELGAAWASKIPILALYAKGEDLGLIRKMVLKWCKNYAELLRGVHCLEIGIKPEYI